MATALDSIGDCVGPLGLAIASGTNRDQGLKSLPLPSTAPSAEVASLSALLL